MDKYDAELGWQSLGKVALKSKTPHWKKSLSLKELLIHIFGWLSHHLHHCIMPVEAWLPNRWIQDISEHTVPLSQFKKPIRNCCIQDFHNTQSYSLSEERKAYSDYHTQSYSLSKSERHTAIMATAGNFLSLTHASTALHSVHVCVSNPQNASHLSIGKMPHTSVRWHVSNFKMVLNESRANYQGMFHNGGPFGADCI